MEETKTTERARSPYSASQMYRRWRCPASRHMEDGLPDSDSEHAASGRRIHEAVARGEPYMLEDDGEAEIAEQILEVVDRDTDGADAVYSEHYVELEYPFVGHADRIAIWSGQARGVVWDWKTGFIPLEGDEVSWQGSIYGAGAILAFDLAEVDVWFYMPRLNDWTKFRVDRSHIPSILDKCRAVEHQCESGVFLSESMALKAVMAIQDEFRQSQGPLADAAFSPELRKALISELGGRASKDDSWLGIPLAPSAAGCRYCKAVGFCAGPKMLEPSVCDTDRRGLDGKQISQLYERSKVVEKAIAARKDELKCAIAEKRPGLRYEFKGRKGNRYFPDNVALYKRMQLRDEEFIRLLKAPWGTVKKAWLDRHADEYETKGAADKAFDDTFRDIVDRRAEAKVIVRKEDSDG